MLPDQMTGSSRTGVLQAPADANGSSLAIHQPFSRFIKRTMDVVLALLMILFIAPWLFTIVIMVIVIESKGNPFFVQKRTGRNLTTFYCIKFRTMVLNKDSHRIQVQVNDSRITRTGRFLRNHHIDELPQVFNVLFGSMSIVGPRPHMLRQHVLFSQISPDYNSRHSVKPGMTGLAQVRGFHGMVHSAEHYHDRLNSDLEYIRNWSLLTDIRIFFLTTFQTIFLR
jgi:putative colanic acid biosynthesis UDP-glucose lipid carrier transferase